MAMADQNARQGFRLSMLIYDTRYRSLTIQVVVLMGFMAGGVWLISNMLANLEALGKDLGFGFLKVQAGFEIQPQLIEYSSQSSNLRAMMVGLLNTLMVAVIGCFFATIIGVMIGVARLSKNWIISLLMSVYVEMFRNVPVLLWIVFSLAILSETLPKPNDFRGADATATMYLSESIAFTNRGFYIPLPVFGAGSMVVVITFILALVGVFFFGRWSKTRQEQTGDILPNFWIKLAILVVPALIIFFIMGRPIGLDYPALKGFNFQGGLKIGTPFLAILFALVAYTAAFIAEAVRSGIQAIDKGQSEAAFALGLRPNRTMSLIILPQALRVIIPPLISQYLNLAKNSSLAVAVGYIEIMGTIGGSVLNQTGREMECILLVMVAYLSISLSVSMIMNLYNNSVKLKER